MKSHPLAPWLVLAAAAGAAPAIAAVQPQSSYAACPSVVDIGRMRVMPARRTLDGFILGSCYPDERQSQPLSFEACDFLALPARGVAIEQHRLVFRSGKALVEAAPCTPKPGGRSLKLAETASGCAMTHDWTNGWSFERTRFVFDAGGSQVQTTPCMEREDRGMRHRRAACPPISVQLPRAGLVRIPAERIEATAETRVAVVRACQPSIGGAVATALGAAGVAVDGDACRGVIADGDGESYATIRYVLTWPDGSRTEPVTNCLPDVGRAYRHALEEAGWRHDEARRISYGLDQATIRIGDATRKVGKPTQRPNAVGWPQQSVAIVETGSTERVGCAVLRHTRFRGTYARPDGTSVEIWLGPAEAIADTKGCR